jgi:hypothetical protein
MARRWREPWGEEHPHRDVTEAVIAAALRVQTALGPGLEEAAYRLCLAHSLRQDGHPTLRDVRWDLNYEGLLLNFRAWPLKQGGIRRMIHTRQPIP